MMKVLLSILLFASAFADDDIILQPPTKDGAPAAIIFAPGAGLLPETYIPLLSKVQEKFSSIGLSLWVGIPKMPFDVATLGLKKAVARVAGELTEAGLPDDHATFYGGKIQNSLFRVIVKCGRFHINVDIYLSIIPLIVGFIFLHLVVIFISSSCS